jgi:hypothetical protein
MIKSLSPYYVETSFVSPRSGLTSTAYTLNIFVWNGASTNAPITPSYPITKNNPTGSTSTDKINIARIINSFITVTPQKGTTQELLDGNNQKWCKTEVVYATTDETDAIVPQNVSIDLVTRGYNYGMDGENGQQPSNKIMVSSGIEYNVNRSGFFSLPIELDAIIKIIDAVNDAIGLIYQDTQLDILPNDNLGYQPTAIILIEDAFPADYGTIAINGNFVDFTSGTTFNGSPQTFTYTISDSLGNQSTATVTLTATALPVVLTAVDDLYEANTTDVVDLYLMDNDIDGGNPPIDITSVVQTGLTSGAIAIDASGDYVTFTPNGVVPNGDETFTYTITDGIAGTDSATVTLRVTAKGRYLEEIFNAPFDEITVTGIYSDTGNGFSFKIAGESRFDVNRCVVESSLASSGITPLYIWDDLITC